MNGSIFFWNYQFKFEFIIFFNLYLSILFFYFPREKANEVLIITLISFVIFPMAFNRTNDCDIFWLIRVFGVPSFTEIMGKGICSRFVDIFSAYLTNVIAFFPYFFEKVFLTTKFFESLVRPFSVFFQHFTFLKKRYMDTERGAFSALSHKHRF